MQKLVITVLLSIALASTAQASKLTKEEIHQACDNIAGLAEVTAEARYFNELPKSTAIEMTKNNPLWTSIVHDAYAMPYFKTKKEQEKAIRDFKEDTYGNCLRILSDKQVKRQD